MKAPTRREELRRQLGEHVGGLVKGYAQEAHCHPVVAELIVRGSLRDILQQMEGGIMKNTLNAGRWRVFWMLTVEIIKDAMKKKGEK